MYLENLDYSLLRPRVELLGSERRSLRSNIIDQSYDLYVNFPKSYWHSEEKINYPVLYVLNGQWDFSLILGSFGNQNYDGLIPEILIVGITWSGSEIKEVDFTQLGLRDFSPTKNQNESAGGAEIFIRVLKEEIIPFVEQSYPVTNNRGLAAGSLAALFATFCMLKEPNLFQKYILSSPTVHWDNKYIFAVEQEFANKNVDLNALIGVSWGELEDFTVVEDFFRKLNSRHFTNTRIKTFEIPGTGHAGNKSIGFGYAMLFVYGHPKYIISPEQLCNFSGSYKFNNQLLTVTQISTELVVSGISKKPINLIALSKNYFHASGQFLFLKFINDEETVIGLEVEVWDRKISYQRIPTN